MILLIDNYDSFIYNLYQAFGKLKQKVVVKRNDKITLRQAKRLKPEYLVISPGPKTPADAGVSSELIKYFAGRIPVLGVCLGHQCIGYVFGAKIGQTSVPMHGKVSMVYHDQKTIFSGIPNPFVAARYHSLGVLEEGLPGDIEISAYTPCGEIMGIRIKGKNVEGVQFHPESFLTPSGKTILRNFLLLK